MTSLLYWLPILLRSFARFPFFALLSPDVFFLHELDSDIVLWLHCL